MRAHGVIDSQSGTSVVTRPLRKGRAKDGAPALAVPGVRLHLYEKLRPRKGRKMGISARGRPLRMKLWSWC